nr:hypothetical protein [Pandoravirus aubagnensis]
MKREKKAQRDNREHKQRQQQQTLTNHHTQLVVTFFPACLHWRALFFALAGIVPCVFFGERGGGHFLLHREWTKFLRGRQKKRGISRQDDRQVCSGATRTKPMPPSDALRFFLG